MADATDLVEERLGTLEAWLEEEPDNQSLNDKRDEYLGLLEELELLQKKLRKTAKLLLQESNEKTLVKLAKKEEQYSHEIEDLVQYVQSDAMFDEATMEPSELLGEPLETLIEQPGLEGSSGTLNISLSDMPYFPRRQKSNGSASNINYNNSRGRLALNPDDDSEFDDLHAISEAEESSHNNQSSMASLTQSMQSLEASNPKKKQSEILYDPTTLRKKLKKVEKMIRGEKDAKTLKKLKKKRDQYQQELLQVNSTTTGGGGSSDDGEMSSIDRSLDLDSVDRGLVSRDESSCDTVDLLGESTVSLESMGKSLRSLKSTGSKHNKAYDASTLKKKMKKVKKLLAATEDEEEREKYILKFDEYEQALEELHSQSLHASGGDIGEEPKSAQQSSRTVTTAGSSSSTVQKSGEGSGMSAKEKERYKMLQQKMQKAKKLIKSAKDQGDTDRAGKLEKKRQQYKAEIEALKQR